MKRLIPILFLLASGVAYGGVGDKYMCDVVQRPWIEYDPRLDINRIINKPVSEWIYQVKFSIDWKSKETVFIQKYEIWGDEKKKTWSWDVDVKTKHGEWVLDGFVGTQWHWGIGSIYFSFSESTGRLLLVDSFGQTDAFGEGLYDVYVWRLMCTKF
jgi:hypothetical protein